MDVWEQEALRLCDRYVREVVLAFDLCPWAEASLRAGRVSRAVCMVPEPVPAECLPFVDTLDSSNVPPMDIGLLIFPRHSGGWSAFDGFAERVRRALGERRDRRADVKTTDPASGRFLVAAFHPDGAETFVGPHQMVSFVRRTPDPLLQFVRVDIIDRLNDSQPEMSEVVTRRNHEALQGERALQLDAVTRAIRADRDATYGRLRSDPNAA